MPHTKALFWGTRACIPVILLLASCGPVQTQSGSSGSLTSFGAKGDAITHDDGVAVAGSTNFSSQSSSFSSADVGKFTEITGAGSNAGMLHGAGTANGILATTIQSVLNSHTVILGNAASYAGSNLHFVYGTDNTAAFRSAYESGQPMFVPAGNYLIVAGTQTVPATITGTQPLILAGTGADSKLLSDNPIFSLTTSTSGSSVKNLDLEPIAKFAVVAVNAVPPPSGTPVLVDIFGTGTGMQPSFNFAPKYPTFWNGLSAFQQTQILGPTITIQGGDHVNVSTITGNQVTILLEDVTSSSLQNNDFTGGYGPNANEGTGGVQGCLGIATLTGSGQYSNVGNTISGNNIRYCSFSNIFWSNADGLVVSDNISQYSGESGYKNFQGSATRPTHNLSVTNNIARYSVFDGFDLSADYPHKATFPEYATVMGNLSQNNQSTGYFSDGTNWNFTANTASSNGIEGFYLDYSNSVISGNVSLNNNLNSLNSPNSDNQFVIGGCCITSNNVIENNLIALTIAGISGDAMWVGSSTVTANNNVVQELPGEGGLWFNVPPTSSSGNTGWPTTFNGNVTINGNLGVIGTLSKAAGSFRIDHPLDPLNKYLLHSFVESPDMLNIYNGIVELDSKGRAEVTLPSYFEALNGDFRYQLTCIGKSSPVYVAREVKDNKFLIAGGTRGTRVSWQVTGIRRDPYSQAHRILPEMEKPESERGHYLYPEIYPEGEK
ncbi:MAG TPA: tail spike protein [Candidatus Sulfotelmatobacter sp.]|jgi:hypothetical protein